MRGAARLLDLFRPALRLQLALNPQAVSNGQSIGRGRSTARLSQIPQKLCGRRSQIPAFVSVRMRDAISNSVCHFRRSCLVCRLLFEEPRSAEAMFTSHVGSSGIASSSYFGLGSEIGIELDLVTPSSSKKSHANLLSIGVPGARYSQGGFPLHLEVWLLSWLSVK